jgi:ubiquinone/menaquinone biosynthesis C-methylase UbiE
MSNTNIDFWTRIIKNPSPKYRELFQKETEYLINKIPINSSVLDVGCGDGRVIKIILETTQNITGVDNESAAIQEAKERLASFPSVKLFVADGMQLPFEDKVFDVVVFMMTLVNLGQNKVAILKEIQRVLKIDGVVILSVYSEDAYETRLATYTEIGLPIKSVSGGNFTFDAMDTAKTSEQFSQMELTSIAQEAGFKVVDIQKVDEIAYLCTLQRN